MSFAPLSASNQVYFTAALQQWADVANLQFSLVADTSTGVGDIRVAFSYLSSYADAQAWSTTPGDSPAAGDVWFNRISSSAINSWAPGSFSFFTASHELCHALGFKHPFYEPDSSGAVLPSSLDTGQYTVMSYNLTVSTVAQATTHWTGGAGLDVAGYSGNRSGFTLTPSGAGFMVTDNAGINGTDTLTNIERLRFSDRGVALDVAGGNAGATAKILSAVFGKSSVSSESYSKQYMGIGLSYIDNGMSYQDLMLFALKAKLGAGFTDADEVDLLYQNLTGSLPSAADLNYWTGTLASGQYTQVSLAAMAADHNLNTANINLVGLAQTGIEFV